nr:immunoglobulin light chain junction region [Macaca mulatta]MOX42350.1 immunoglobulin light chain junction region [Macaca mulatta]MOX43390.1 immunoglobulin light chain junction region [Macaca mulatta]MOX45616.1 immunoglobulin light chain junction region [Macaca mulatta]MOX47565.1 immunoglobulin light chain junction region [Macaca mulatta]
DYYCQSADSIDHHVLF